MPRDRLIFEISSIFVLFFFISNRYLYTSSRRFTRYENVFASLFMLMFDYENCFTTDNVKMALNELFANRLKLFQVLSLMKHLFAGKKLILIPERKLFIK